MVLSAFINAAKSSPSSVIISFPAMPFARTTTISFVDVSPSMLIILKVSVISLERAFCNIEGAIATSDVINTSMVAIFGWIMPLPFAIPPMRQVFPPSSNSTATDFLTVSVVMMPSAARSLPSALRPFASSEMPSAIGAISSGCPITPVDATTTSAALIFSSPAASAAISSATASPFGAQVLAFPLLQIIACAWPSAICCFVTAIGAPFTRFVV